MRGVGWPAEATPAMQEPHHRAPHTGAAGVQRRDRGLAPSESRPTARSLVGRWKPMWHTLAPILLTFLPGWELSSHQEASSLSSWTLSYSAAPLASRTSVSMILLGWEKAPQFIPWALWFLCLLWFSSPESGLTLCNPMDCSLHQASLSMGFSRQQYRSGLPSLLQGIFLTQGLNPCLLH